MAVTAPERFLLRAEGGPCDGEVCVANSDGTGAWTWPLPDVLDYDSTGRYVKTAEGSLPGWPGSPYLLRGAAYQWEEAAR
jgi:hypothetical protein